MLYLPQHSINRKFFFLNVTHPSLLLQYTACIFPNQINYLEVPDSKIKIYYKVFLKIISTKVSTPTKQISAVHN